MRITLSEQLENLWNALANAEREADYSGSVAYAQHAALCDELWNLDYELRRLQDIVSGLQARAEAQTSALLPTGV